MATVAGAFAVSRSGVGKRSARRAAWVWPGAAALVAALVTGWGLSRSSITLVGTATLTAATRPLSKLPALLNHTDAVLAPYYVVMHLWLQLGHSLWWVRLPGVVASAATAALVVVVGRRISPSVGVVGGLLFAVAADTSRYAEDARPYAFAILFATFVTYRLQVAMERPSRGAWIWYAVAVVLTGATHIFALLLLPAHAYFARRRIRPWLAGVAAAVVVLSPLLALGAAQVGGELSWADKPGLHSLRALAGQLSGSAALTVVLGVLLLLGVRNLWRIEPDAAVLLTGWLVVPPVLLFAVSQVHAVFASRYLAFTTPAMCLLVAAGVVALPRWAAAVAGVLVVVLLVPVQFGLRRTPGHDGNNIGFVARKLSALSLPSDGIVYEPDTARRVFYGFAKLPPGKDLLLRASPQASDTLSGSNVDAAVLAQRMAAVNRVWVVRVSDRNIATSNIYRQAQQDLRRFQLVRTIKMTGGTLTLYQAG